MRAFAFHHYTASRLLWLGLAALLMRPLGAAGATEEVFEVLKTKTVTYTNVTVTTKARNYIFILHAAGMASIKLGELSPELQKKLGYASETSLKGPTNAAAVWVNKGLAKMDTPRVRDLRKQLGQRWQGQSLAGLSVRGLAGRTLLFAVLGTMLLLYLFYCYCCMLICQKSNQPPGVLVWLPILQFFPLLRAAGMSGWWFVAYLVPGINLVAQILWSLKIAKARGKSVWVGALLLLPVINLVSFLYLAFSSAGTGGGDEDGEPRVMSLQSA